MSTSSGPFLPPVWSAGAGVIGTHKFLRFSLARRRNRPREPMARGSSSTNATKAAANTNAHPAAAAAACDWTCARSSAALGNEKIPMDTDRSCSIAKMHRSRWQCGFESISNAVNNMHTACNAAISTHMVKETFRFLLPPCFPVQVRDGPAGDSLQFIHKQHWVRIPVDHQGRGVSVIRRFGGGTL